MHPLPNIPSNKLYHFVPINIILKQLGSNWNMKSKVRKHKKTVGRKRFVWIRVNWSLARPPKVIPRVPVKKRPPILCLINLSCTPFLVNFGPLIANMNSKFANFIMCGEEKIQCFYMTSGVSTNTPKSKIFFLKFKMDILIFNFFHFLEC